MSSMDTVVTANKKTLLIVEDEASLVSAMKDQFEREGFKVITAVDGGEGLKTAMSVRPDLIILDILMPKVGGLEMLRTLRTQGEFGKNVKVIILTNLDTSDAILKEVTETLPTFYLIKADTTMEGLLSKVREVLDAQPML